MGRACPPPSVHFFPWRSVRTAGVPTSDSKDWMITHGIVVSWSSVGENGCHSLPCCPGMKRHSEKKQTIVTGIELGCVDWWGGARAVCSIPFCQNQPFLQCTSVWVHICWRIYLYYSARLALFAYDFSSISFVCSLRKYIYFYGKHLSNI